MSEFIFRSLLEHISSLKNKEYSSEELTRAYLDRMAQSGLNAYLAQNEHAIESAKLSDKRRASGEPLSPLDGIPYAAKDNLSTKGLRTTCASKMLENYVPPFDAHVIESLKSRGAVLLGKTNLDEFAMGVSTETSYFGATLNPIDKRFVAGGSSGGSAAAIAAGEAAFALGSDTGGSVRQPAAFCGAVGMRPTYGAISRYGLISFSPSLDQIGPITKNVLDNATVLAALCSRDARDESSVGLNGNLTDSISDGISGMRIAVLGGIDGHSVSADVKDAIDACAKSLASLGADVEEISLPNARDAYAAYYVISCAEASSNLSRFDGVRYGFCSTSYSSIDELYTTTRSEGFGGEAKRRILFGTMALSAEYRNDFYQRAKTTRAIIARELCAALEKYEAILLPTAPSSAYKLGEAAKLGFEACVDDIFCTLAALAGLPAISLPYRAEGKMPVGVQLMGKAFGERELYRIAYALEKSISGGTV